MDYTFLKQKVKNRFNFTESWNSKFRTTKLENSDMVIIFSDETSQGRKDTMKVFLKSSKVDLRFPYYTFDIRTNTIMFSHEDVIRQLEGLLSPVHKHLCSLGYQITHNTFEMIEEVIKVDK